MDDLKSMTTEQLRALLHTLRHDDVHGKADADRRHAVVAELHARKEDVPAAPAAAPTPDQVK